MRFFDSEDALQTSLDAFLAEHKTHLGLVSLEVPLISNLPVWSNIALIRQYHENMFWEEAKMLTLDLLQRFGMAATAEKRNPSLTAEERFCRNPTVHFGKRCGAVMPQRRPPQSPRSMTPSPV